MRFFRATGNPLAYWLYPFARSLTTSAKPSANAPLRGIGLHYVFL